jgi:hypothetical protein
VNGYEDPKSRDPGIREGWVVEDTNFFAKEFSELTAPRTVRGQILKFKACL